MMNRIIVLLLLSLLIAFPTCLVPVDAATVCTVNYYYTSTDNPEGVPDPTSGMFSGDKWKITPAEVSQMVYTKTVGAKTETYTFKGWYTNINCLGKKYTPGAETTELKPSVVNGTYTLNLYGKWKCSETGGEEGKQEGETIEEENADSVAGISSISAYTFPEVGSTRPLEAKFSSGSVLSYSSSNPAVVSVDENGLMKANGAGSADITITCVGDAGADPISRTVAVIQQQRDGACTMEAYFDRYIFSYQRQEVQFFQTREVLEGQQWKLERKDRRKWEYPELHHPAYSFA